MLSVHALTLEAWKRWICYLILIFLYNKYTEWRYHTHAQCQKFLFLFHTYYRRHLVKRGVFPLDKCLRTHNGWARESRGTWRRDRPEWKPCMWRLGPSGDVAEAQCEETSGGRRLLPQHCSRSPLRPDYSATWWGTGASLRWWGHAVIRRLHPDNQACYEMGRSSMRKNKREEFCISPGYVKNDVTFRPLAT